MSNKLVRDPYGEDARVIKEADITIPYKSWGNFAKLQYSGIDQPISRLRVFDVRKRFSYTLYGLFSPHTALSIAIDLPPVRANDDGMRCIVGLLEATDCSSTRNTDPSSRHVLRVEDEGGSPHKFQTVFKVGDFGRQSCSIYDLEGVVFPGEKYVLKAMGVRGKLLAFPGIA